MNDTRQHLEHLAEMRSLMERSTRFLSLSGLSGVWAGACALVGAFVVYQYLEIDPFSMRDSEVYYNKAVRTIKWGADYRSVFVLIATLVLAAALAGGVFFTTRKARKRGEKVWDASSGACNTADYRWSFRTRFVISRICKFFGPQYTGVLWIGAGKW